MGSVLLSWEICRVVGALLLGTAPSILEAALALAAALVARLASTRLSARESFAAPQDVKGALRRRIYEKLLRLGTGYAQDVFTAEVVQLSVEGCEQLETYFGQYLPQLFYSVLAPVTLFCVVAPACLPAAVGLLVCVPLISLVIVSVKKVAKRILSRYWDQYATLGDSFLENLQGLTTLKIYQADAERHHRMNQEAGHFRVVTMKVLSMQLNSIIVMDVVALGGAAAGISVALWQLAAGSIAPTVALFVALASADFFLPMRQLGSSFHVAMNGMAASEKIFRLLDLEEPPARTLTPAPADALSMRDVDFSYDGNRKVLSNLTLEVSPQGMTAVVGVSGSGKSTVASLLCGHKRGWTGDVLVGETSVDQVDPAALSRHVTMAAAGAHVFSVTVRENLLMARPEATDNQLWAALKTVRLDGFVHERGGLDMAIEQDAANLSGGQRQRLALARALLHDTPAYVFDEATSNIDAESEEQVMTAVRELSRERAVLVISHRLANVVDAARIMWRMLGFVKPLAGVMVVSVACGVVGFCCTTGIPVLAAEEVLALAGSGSLTWPLATVCWALAAMALARGVLHYIEQRCNHYIAFRLLTRIRDLVFGALRKLAPAKLSGRDRGSLVSTVTSDVELLEVFFAHTISPVCIATLMAIVGAAFLWQLAPAFALVALVAWVLVGITVPLSVSRGSGDAGRRQRDLAGSLSGYVLDGLRGLGEVLQFGAGAARLDGLDARSRELVEAEREVRQAGARGSSAVSAVILLATIAELALGAQLVSAGDATPEATVLATVFVLSSFGPFAALANLGATLQGTLASGARVLEILYEKPQVDEVENGVVVTFSDASAEHVDFSYGAEKVLSDVSVRIPAGRIVGISGRNGPGKSTLARLLMRFWDVDQGRIALSGTDVREIRTASLRDAGALVEQDTSLFHDSIRDNLLIAKPTATQAELEEACRKASIRDFIEGLPEGYETMVGELGGTLSSGERQRLGLARAFLHDAPFLLLDEPTSNLDSLNEGQVLRSLDEERGRRAALLVSHRASTMTVADEVHSMDSGRVS